ncbi:Zn-ribbon domain-containing OB-fold protein [Microbacterium sp. B2969]|uniref:Zn-ribbon domain-containing OB-fold protein n=1 Tax=Microbacterium alkaliflavum TaxID=3248839 RepID=A0ABW7Q2I2_9MICO
MTPMTSVAVPRPVADLDTDDLLGDFPEGRRLIGTQCDDCGRLMIGTRMVCSSCVGTEVTRVALPTTGVLYTFTRLHVGSDGVRLLGYVDFDGDVRTLTDLREDAGALEPGTRVELAVDGDDWWFAAVPDAERTDS